MTNTTIKHGHNRRGAATGTYRSWNAMWQRCTNPRNAKHASYGATGITVCERWRDFRCFLADMGERPEGTTIDRFPNLKGNYEPGNCRWAAPRAQQQNIKSNRLITFDGQTKCQNQWARDTGIAAKLIAFRIKRGWSLTDVFGVFPQKGNRINGRKSAPRL
jgi:hypothetical protein